MDEEKGDKMKLKVSDYVRWALMIFLIVYIFRGEMWAIKLCLVLAMIRVELLDLLDSVRYESDKSKELISEMFKSLPKNKK